MPKAAAPAIMSARIGLHDSLYFRGVINAPCCWLDTRTLLVRSLNRASMPCYDFGVAVAAPGPLGRLKKLPLYKSSSCDSTARCRER